MKRQQNTKLLLLLLKFIFYFRRPVFLQLEFIDVVIGDRPQLLLVWKLQGGFRIKLAPLRRDYFVDEGSILVVLPDDLKSVTIEAHNIWRKRKVSLKLIHTKLDSVTANYFKTYMASVSHTGLVKKAYPTIPELQKILFELNIPTPDIRRTAFRIRHITPRFNLAISLNEQAYYYQNKSIL